MATNLAEIYANASSDQLTRVKIQASGEARSPSALNSYPPVNYMEDTFQKEFRSRGYGDKNVAQSTGEDDTNGTFVSRALNYYTEQVVDSKFIQYHGKLVHWYNARTPATYYSTLNGTTRGILNSYAGI